MPGYVWSYADNLSPVTTGANAQVVFGGVIQRPDNHEGYNTKFGVTGSVASYHVHFRAGGTLVTTVRYFPQSTVQGNNVTVFNPQANGDPASRKDLGNLANYCLNNGYPNHAALLNNLAAAIPPARTPNGEIV